ncbi:MAG: lytic transglycosylase domain-containing protein, partial [Bradyrhizobium sp.]
MIIGSHAWASEAAAKHKIPLPKARPIARNAVPKTTEKAADKAGARTTSKSAGRLTSTLPSAAIAPATRQHAALPPPAARKPSVPAAMATTSSTSADDKEALGNVIGLVRKHEPADATQAEAAISDPLARKLAEWIILRSDDNGASVERYHAFLAANPSWPSQTFLRRRLEAALWDDHRDDATVWAWFENESPLSAKGKFSLARVMLARGDRANAERLVRDAWRNDAMSEETEDTALDLFGPLITPGDHKARMDLLLYGSEHEAALRAAKRLGSSEVALAKARIAGYRKASNARALLEAVPHELHNDAGYIFSRIQLLRREEKFVEAAQLMMSA